MATGLNVADILSKAKENANAAATAVKNETFDINNVTSPYKFADWASTQGYNYNYDQTNKIHTINGIALPDNIMNAVKSEYSTPKVYQSVIDEYTKLVEQQNLQSKVTLPTQTGGTGAKKSDLTTGEYVSPYQAQIKLVLDQLNAFTPYKTPQELEQYVFNLMESANKPFTYDPATDQGLVQAQQEAERLQREGAAAKGTLYSSGTISKTAQAKAALIPEYEQKAYSRFADTKNREIQMVSTLMQWDEMQANRYNDQLDIIKTKFDYIMQLEGQDFSKFQMLLEQRNFQKEYDLNVQRYNFDKKIADIENAYKKVDALGYVDNNSAKILGIKAGTKASWVKALEIEHKNDLAKLKQEFANQKKIQAAQTKIEKSLIRYKNSIETASKKKQMAQQYKYDKSIATIQGKASLGEYVSSNGAGILNSAKALLGTKYVWGGESLSGMDCSGFTQYVMRQNGASIPRTVAEQAQSGTTVSKSSLKAGDLVFFNTIAGNGKNVDHVGIYLGNGRMIHASSGSGKVITADITTSYWQNRYTTAKRYGTSGGNIMVSTSTKKKSTAKKKSTTKKKSTAKKTTKKYVSTKKTSQDAMYAAYRK